MRFVRCMGCDRLLESTGTGAVLGLDEPDDECGCLVPGYEIVAESSEVCR